VLEKMPKSVAMSEKKGQRVQWWQWEWMETTKCAMTKAFLPKIEDSLKLRLNATPNTTAIVEDLVI